MNVEKVECWTEFNCFNLECYEKVKNRLQLCAQQKVSPMTVIFCIASRI